MKFIILFWVLFAVCLTQFLYSPKLNLSLNDIKKIKIGMNLEDVLKITKGEKKRAIHLFGYGDYSLNKNAHNNNKSDTMILDINDSIYSLISNFYSKKLLDSVENDVQNIEYKYGMFELKSENRDFSLFNGQQLIITFNKQFKVIEVRFMDTQPDVWETLYNTKDTEWFKKLDIN